MAKIPTVIVDYDDVCAPFIEPLAQTHNWLRGTFLSASDFKTWNFNDMEIIDVHGNTTRGNEIYATMKEYELEIYSSMEPYSDTRFALETIRAIGYKVIILTARPEQFRKQTLFNINKNKLSFDEVIFDWDKAKVIQELSKTHCVKLFVDDNSATIQAVWEKCKVDTVCLMERKHNSDAELDDEIKRVGSLIDCVKYLKKVVKKGK
jgi:phosphoglycolate phosphatase-like HAD superfamily hydrolase